MQVLRLEEHARARQRIGGARGEHRRAVGHAGDALGGARHVGEGRQAQGAHRASGNSLGARAARAPEARPFGEGPTRLPIPLPRPPGTQVGRIRSRSPDRILSGSSDLVPGRFPRAGAVAIGGARGRTGQGSTTTMRTSGEARARGAGRRAPRRRGLPALRGLSRARVAPDRRRPGCGPDPAAAERRAAPRSGNTPSRPRPSGNTPAACATRTASPSRRRRERAGPRRTRDGRQIASDLLSLQLYGQHVDDASPAATGPRGQGDRAG